MAELDATTPKAATVSEILRLQAEERGEDPVYRYLADGETETRALSFAQLEREARALGSELQTAAQRGERALLLVVDGIDFIRAFMACQLCGVIAVPAYPPFPVQSKRRMETLAGIVQDCTPSVVLSGGPSALDEAVRAGVEELADRPWVAVDAIPEGLADSFSDTRLRSEDISFLQYTSGSTSEPKGVIVTHDALMHNEELIRRQFAVTHEDRLVSWLPLYHDMGLIGAVLQTLYTGLETTLLPPLAFVQRPVRWLRAITRYRATVSGGPNFGYELCVRRIPPESWPELDLSCWDIAFSGAEPVRASTLHAFNEAFSPHGFHPQAWYPCYGLAEVTLLATSNERGGGALRFAVDREALEAGSLVPGTGRELVSAGRARFHRRVEIVDPDTLDRVPTGQVGEIWLAGPDVAGGYWERDSSAVFEAHVNGVDDGSFLRTGDLGAMYQDQLVVTGRLKDVVIVAGRNHYPQDIEATVESSHPAIRRGCCAAFAVDTPTGEHLVVVAEIRGESASDKPDVQRSARAAISAAHGIEIGDLLLVAPGSVPKTSSGKLQRRACRDAYLAGALPSEQAARVLEGTPG